jgi:hypothetical protein
MIILFWSFYSASEIEPRLFHLLAKHSTIWAMSLVFLFLFWIILRYILSVHKKGLHFYPYTNAVYFDHVHHSITPYPTALLLFPSTSLVIPICFHDLIFVFVFIFPQLPHIRENV